MLEFVVFQFELRILFKEPHRVTNVCSLESANLCEFENVIDQLCCSLNQNHKDQNETIINYILISLIEYIFLCKIGASCLRIDQHIITDLT